MTDNYLGAMSCPLDTAEKMLPTIFVINRQLGILHPSKNNNGLLFELPWQTIVLKASKGIINLLFLTLEKTLFVQR